MSTVLTVMNMKGGVGKTTVSMHLAGALARYDYISGKACKVLVIDYDPQFNLSQAFLPPRIYFELEKRKKTTMSILVDDVDKVNPFQLQVPGNHQPPAVADVAYRIYEDKRTGALLDLIPSTLSLMYVALGRANAQVKPIEERFAKFIGEARGFYDFVIIDCHPAGSVFTQTSLQNTDHLLIPVVLERYAARGIGLMLEFVQSKEVGGKNIRTHILFNRTSRRGIDAKEEEIRMTRGISGLCVKTTLKKLKAFSEPEGGKGFVWSSKKSYSTEARVNLLMVGRDLMDRIGDA